MSDSPELLKPGTEVTDSQLQIDICNLETENETLKTDYAALLESSTAVTNRLKEELQKVRSQLETERADREEVEAELADIAQLKKQVKESAAELHREERCLEFEKVRWQQELSDARGEIADAKATILKKSDKIRELERGYSLKPNPAESRLRLEIGDPQEQLSDLRQNSVTASELPEAADLLNQLKGRRKKSKADLADMEAVLDVLAELGT